VIEHRRENRHRRSRAGGADDEFLREEIGGGMHRRGKPAHANPRRKRGRAEPDETVGIDLDVGLSGQRLIHHIA